jgi:hypothetical protein
LSYPVFDREGRLGCAVYFRLQATSAKGTTMERKSSPLEKSHVDLINKSGLLDCETPNKPVTLFGSPIKVIAQDPDGPCGLQVCDPQDNKWLERTILCDNMKQAQQRARAFQLMSYPAIRCKVRVVGQGGKVLSIFDVLEGDLYPGTAPN